MNFDFPTFLVLFTLVTGLVWAADAWLLAPKRRQKAAAVQAGGSAEQIEVELAKAMREPYLVEMSKSFFPIVLIVLVVRSFMAEPFRIPSGSMMPSLLIGDFILVNKFSYGIRLPVINKKIIDIDDPVRGDVIVFRYPEDTSIDYIKRVVGVPGDHIAYRNKILYVNGDQAKQTELDRYIGVGSGAVMTGAYHRTESMDGQDHEILMMGQRPIMDFEYTVPDKSYFVMGDNRDNSRDSRFWGTVPDENLIGKAFMIWMNWDSESEGIVAWDRIGDTIH